MRLFCKSGIKTKWEQRQRTDSLRRLCCNMVLSGKGTYEKHLFVLDFEKKERAKEVAELEQTISGCKEELYDILHQHIAAGQETEQIRKEGEAIRQEVSDLGRLERHLGREQVQSIVERSKALE